MRRVLRLLAIVVLLLVFGIGIAFFTFRAALMGIFSVFAGGDVDTAIANLPQVSVLARLGDRAAEADMILFQDGKDGWFMIPEPTALGETEIGFFGTRIGDAMFGARHIPLYCTSSASPNNGKVIWAVADDDILTELAYCNTRRMDLANLRPFAEPVNMQSAMLTRQEANDQMVMIDADPQIKAVSLPTAFEAFDFQRQIRLPVNWYIWGDSSPSSFDLHAPLEAALAAHMEGRDPNYAVRFRSESASELTRFVLSGDEGYVPAETGPALRVGDQTFITTGVNWIDRIVMVVECDQAACAAIEGFDPVPSLRPGREQRLLRAALDNLVLLEDRVPGDNMMSEADLRDESVTFQPIAENRYLLRWITPRAN